MMNVNGMVLGKDGAMQTRCLGQSFRLFAADGLTIKVRLGGIGAGLKDKFAGVCVDIR